MGDYDQDNHKRTRTAFLGTRLLNTPFWALFNLIPFILLKDLMASPFQVTAVLILKPAVSLIALYWIATIIRRQDRLLKHVVWSHILSYVPFFFLPIIHDPWFIVFAFGFYMIMYRGSIPSWLEILKLNVPASSRSRILAFGSTVGYIGDAFWPLLLGWLLDGYHHAWRWIFPLTAAVAMTAVILQLRVKVSRKEEDGESPLIVPLTQPWQSAWELLKNRPDFAKYQIGFMLGGAGVMIILPALPEFFMHSLNLTYTELSAAITLCKGVGVALSSQMWARWIHKIDVYRFASWVTLLAALFPLCIFFAQYQLFWLFFGYVLYGVMQGGSELGWNMSGPIFSKQDDSASFTSVNIMMQGLRGCVIPALGGFLCANAGPFSVMCMSGVLCLLASYKMNQYSREARVAGTAVALES